MIASPDPPLARQLTSRRQNVKPRMRYRQAHIRAEYQEPPIHAGPHGGLKPVC